MRTVAVVSDRLVAVVAEYTKANRIAMGLEPAMQLRAGVPLVLGSSVDVIESQELDVVIVAARACRVAIAVVHQSFFFQAEDGIRDHCVTGVQTCALPISPSQNVEQVG